MSRNWPASENPPKHWKPTPKHLRELETRRDLVFYEAGDVDVRLEDLRWPECVALAEGIERFIRFNPTNRKGV